MRAEHAIETWKFHQCVLANSAIMSIDIDLVQVFYVHSACDVLDLLVQRLRMKIMQQ
jgi:hypothetical protein